MKKRQLFSLRGRGKAPLNYFVCPVVALVKVSLHHHYNYCNRCPVLFYFLSPDILMKALVTTCWRRGPFILYLACVPLIVSLVDPRCCSGPTRFVCLSFSSSPFAISSKRSSANAQVRAGEHNFDTGLNLQAVSCQQKPSFHCVIDMYTGDVSNLL